MRQGDPISPFLFIIGMEVFSCMVNKMCVGNIFYGFKAPNNGPRISHLLYADDAILIGEWNEQNLTRIKSLLWCFNIISGLRINFSKSDLYGINVGPEDLSSAATSLDCNHSNLPFKYLGSMVGANMNRISNWNPVIEAFDSRLSKWKERTLSIGGALLF